jgi:hypothetical protein
MAFALLPPSAGAERGVRYATAIVRAESRRTVVALRGEFDISTRPDLSERLAQAVASRLGDLVIDLAGVGVGAGNAIGGP